MEKIVAKKWAKWTEEIIVYVFNLGSELGLSLDPENVKESLTFDESHLSSEDIFEIQQPRA